MADELVWRPDRAAVEQSAAPPAVRQDSVSREDAADFQRRWERLARPSPAEEQRDGGQDEPASACWDWLAWEAQAADAPAPCHVEFGLPEERLVRVGADRKESDRASEPAELAAPGLEYRAAQPAARKVVLQRGADARGLIEEREEEPAPREFHAQQVAEFPQ